jgi:hypothetical protein
MCRKLCSALIVLASLSAFSAIPAAYAWLPSDPPPNPVVPPPVPTPTPVPVPLPVPPPPVTPPCHNMPEPSSLVLGLLGAGTLGVRYLRRR